MPIASVRSGDDATATVRGRIADASGNPVSGVKVFVVPSQGVLGLSGGTLNVITNRNGEWEIKLVPSSKNGSYTFIINGVSTKVDVLDGLHSFGDLPRSNK